MRTVLIVVSTLLTIAGLVLAVTGFIYPTEFNLSTASAPQVGQIYSEATFRLAESITCLVLALGSGLIAQSVQDTEIRT